MLANICDNPDVLNVIRIVDIIITIIKVAVPIILIVVSMLDYASAVKDNDADALNKTNKLIVKRVIAIILIFLIPTFINVIARITENSLEYSKCITSATKEGINAAYKNMAQQYIDIANDSLKDSDYQIAYNYVQTKVKDENDKKELLETLDNLKTFIDIRNRIIDLKNNFDLEKYNKLKDDISKIKDEELRKKLEDEFNTIIKPVPGNPKGDSQKSKTMTYTVHAPSMVVPGMPLILYLHGDGGGSDNGSSPFLSAAKKIYSEELPFILVTPKGGMWAETNGRLAELKSIVDTVCEKYQCNKERISIAGHSRGSIGTWHMINNYPGFFYSAVPVSCGSYSITYKNFVKTKIRAFAGTSGEAEYGYNRAMRSNVENIKKAGGDATFYSLDGATHGTSPGKSFTKETLDWMIS